MGLGGLDSALSGLRAAQQQLSVISNNISNASTPGYTRKILPQEATSAGGVGLGVQTDKIVRNVDLTLSRDFWTQTSAVSALDTQAAYLAQIQQYHGDPSQGTSVAAAISKLADSFSALSDSPEDVSMQRTAVDAAQLVAKKIKGFAALVNQMRNDAQTDMASSVSTVNSLLGQIANLNQQISQSTFANQTTAALEDQRDIAIQKLSEQMEISTYKRSDGAMVVQTKQGTLLADEHAQTLIFKPNGSLGPGDAYPSNAAGIFVGDPTKNTSAVDLVDPRNAPGGKLGALIDLRDTTLPRQQAEIDELAEKMAVRFNQQGLKLFTDAGGNIPADSNPVANTTAVPYVGFASVFQINPAVVADNSLLQKGTVPTDMPVQEGSNEVIRRINNFAFGDVAYQTASGTVDVRAAGTGGTDLQQWLGLYSKNQITTNKALNTYGTADSLITAGDSAFNLPGPAQASMTLTFAESRTGTGPVNVTVDLAQANADFPINGTTINSAADQIAAEINAQITAAGVPASLAASASVNAYGQLVLKSTGNITVDASGAGQMGDDGLSFIGLTAGTYTTTDPTFTVQVGDDLPHTISIEPGDDETALVAKLQYNSLTGTGIPGLYVNIDAAGHLVLRPGGDDSNGGPRFGGDLTVTGSEFSADGTGTSGTASGTTLLASLFGNPTPVTNVPYANATPFRTQNLGVNANINTGVLSATNILDYAQKMIDRQTEEATTVQTQNTDETTYKSMIQKTLNDQSGVNIDDELASMITAQTAYSASARVISAINDSFQVLLAAFGR